MLVPVVAIGLVLAGCGGSDKPVTQSDAGYGTTIDINPKDPGELRDGGNLRLAIPGFPSNFNALNIDSDGYASEVVGWTLPHDVEIDAAGVMTVDHDFYTNIKLTSTDPQQVTYTINPKAVWSDGTPITWEDLASQAHALSTKDKTFQINASAGFELVDRVERGVDDRQAVVTFKEPFADWQNQFSPLYPKSVTATPEAFNTSLRDTVPLTAGPFMVDRIDRAANRITLKRNPRWWGDQPKLDTVTYTILDDAAQLAAVQNNELDAADLASSLDQVKEASSSAGVLVRTAPSNQFTHLTFNGAPGSITADPALRVAISKAIDRQGIADAILNGLVSKPAKLDNHMYLEGQKGYQDNAGAVAYDPDAAAAQLDELGWKPGPDGIREKDGRKLEIRDAMTQQDTWTRIAQIMQQNLAKIGVTLKIESYPGTGFFTDVVDPGKFDIANFVWSRGTSRIVALRQVYAFNPDDQQSNFGHIGTPELNAKIDAAGRELDPDKLIEKINDIDKDVFAEGHSLPLFQKAGNVAVRDNLANYGAFGLASADYTKVGFTE